MYQSTLTVTEAIEELYAKTYGGAETIADTWLDEFIMHGHKRGASLESLRIQLLYVLRANCSEIELAENAARITGGPSLDEFAEDA